MLYPTCSPCSRYLFLARNLVWRKLPRPLWRTWTNWAWPNLCLLEIWLHILGYVACDAVSLCCAFVWTLLRLFQHFAASWWSCNLWCTVKTKWLSYLAHIENPLWKQDYVIISTMGFPMVERFCLRIERAQGRQNMIDWTHNISL